MPARAERMGSKAMVRRFAPISHRVPDAAEFIGLSAAKVWELIADGRLSARKIDGSTVVLHDDLLDFVASAPLARKPAQ